ncbi:MAG: hypothetical protein US89_C0016G0036 [Candidatus Peregrinibacteria bacterium GW2011_GWF2_38_29]|nr:MAG: hypothetical protein US89_C0016G0036 [Candidatus Peregrinibacteria bacterium GW2011_GWF2_38_29]HBB03148.1 hypothetical protein [Candidatus Peregrinibacteria bacterium]
MPKGSDKPDDIDGLLQVPDLVFKPEAFESPEWLRLQASIVAFEEERRELQAGAQAGLQPQGNGAVSISAPEVALEVEELSIPDVSVANGVRAKIAAIVRKQVERLGPFWKLLCGIDDGSGMEQTGNVRVEPEADQSDPSAVFRNAPVALEAEDEPDEASNEVALPDDGDFLLDMVFRSDRIKIGDVVYCKAKLSTGLMVYVDADKMRTLLRDEDSGCIIANIQPVVRENFGDKILISVTFYYGDGSRTANAYMDVATGKFLRTSNTGKLIRFLSHGGDYVSDCKTSEVCKFVTLSDGTECYVGLDTLEEKLPTQIS